MSNYYTEKCQFFVFILSDKNYKTTARGTLDKYQVCLVSNNNSVDVLKEALKAKPDMLGVHEDEANQAMIDEGLEDDYYGFGDDNDDDEIVCPLCDAHFQSQEDFNGHVDNDCDKMPSLSCPLCNLDIYDQEQMDLHINNVH